MINENKMTPEGKANELANKFITKSVFDMTDEELKEQRKRAKECALICVDEIIASSPSLPILSDNGTYGSDIEESLVYWKNVKQEINKL